MKVLLIQTEVNGEYFYDYFVRIHRGLIITTADIDSATKYKNTHGARIAKGHIRKWGHDCLILSKDIEDIEREK